MRKLGTFLFGLIAAAIGWVFLQNFDIKGLDNFKVVPRSSQNARDGESLTSLPPAQQKGSIRIASFNIQVFGTSKAKKPLVMDVLAGIVRNFDIVAIQEIRCKDQDLIPSFIDLINSTGRRYDYVIGPRLGRTSSKEQYAFLYDMETIEVDRSQLYTVADPDDLLHREPRVGWFRVRGVAPDQAFTFSLVNIHTDPDETDQELDTLDDVFRVVRDDGRQEDDVIILGDLNVDDRHLGELGQISGMTWVISATPTNTRGTAQYDNIVFQSQATREFTGRGGVFDFLRQYNLSVEEALEVSDHLPVWAEFSSYEGGQPGRIATRPPGTAR